MAFEAEIIGTWGCLPEYYPAVMDMVLANKIDIRPFVEVRPLSQIALGLRRSSQGRLSGESGSF